MHDVRNAKHAASAPVSEGSLKHGLPPDEKLGTYATSDVKLEGASDAAHVKSHDAEHSVEANSFFRQP